MPRKYATVEITEEGMREGMQIEDKDIPSEAKVRLLDALSDTGLKRIDMGSFVSPRYTPQMRNIEEVARGFTPRPGVRYTALIPNDRGRERAREFSDKLGMGGSEGPRAALNCHMCDVFTRRNWNRTQAEEIARWPATVEMAKQREVREAGIGVNAAWGSNFVGPFSHEQRMEMLTRQHSLWDEAGIKVTSCSLGDPMSWCMPHVVEEQILAIKEKWPEISRWSLHLHNGRGMALPSIYAALRVLRSDEYLHIDTTIGGIGGCPYCGNGRATGMAPTEDVVNMLHEMGIETGVDLKKLIEAVWLLEEILGRTTLGHVSKAGWLPRGRDLYDINMPFVETFNEAKHFIKGPSVYAGGVNPWDKPIESDQRAAVDRKLAEDEKEPAAAR